MIDTIVVAFMTAVGACVMIFIGMMDAIIIIVTCLVCWAVLNYIMRRCWKPMPGDNA